MEGPNEGPDMVEVLKRHVAEELPLRKPYVSAMVQYRAKPNRVIAGVITETLPGSARVALTLFSAGGSISSIHDVRYGMGDGCWSWPDRA